MTSCDAANIVVTTNTELTLARSGNCYALSSSQHGTGANNPSDIAGLTTDQAGRSVSFTYESVSSFRIKVSMGQGWSSRNVFFAMKPTIPCMSNFNADMPLFIDEPVDPAVPVLGITCPIKAPGHASGRGYNMWGATSANWENSSAHGIADAPRVCREFQARGVMGGDVQWNAFMVSNAQAENVPEWGMDVWCGHSVSRFNPALHMYTTFFCPPWMPMCNMDLIPQCMPMYAAGAEDVAARQAAVDAFRQQQSSR